jgi:hypothetical protein
MRGGFPRGHGKRIELRRCVDAFGAAEQTFDSENLDARNFVL